MAYTYERTFAPSEDLSNFAAKKLGLSVELAIFTHYLHVTQAPRKPTGDAALVDFSDTGVQGDYIKMLVDRHAPNINERELRADSRIKDKLRVPDISTYGGRFVPPRILANKIESLNRNEYYEIKPNSDTGEGDGVEKLEAIAESYKRYGLLKTYWPGKVYPLESPDYIPLQWSEAFEYLRLVFMWENNLKTCDLDLQVVRLPHIDGLILYAFRVRLELDVQLAQDKLRALAAGVLAAAAICAAANILELVAALEAFAMTEALLEALRQLIESAPAPAPIPRVRIAPDPPTGPRIKEPPPTPEELPKMDVEPDDIYDPDEEEFPKWKMGIAGALIGRGYAVPRKKLDLFCDEDYYKNVIFDDSQVRRFVSMTRLAVPLLPAITVASAYIRMAIPGFILATKLVEQIEQRLPNQMRLRLRDRIPDALRRIAGLPGQNMVTIVSQVLIQTPAMAAFIDPELRVNTSKRVDRAGGGIGRGKIALPPEILSRWRGRDASVGAKSQPSTSAELAVALLGSNPDERNRKYFFDALSGVDLLKHALHSGPGFTVGIGVHALYHLAPGPVTQERRFGELKAVNLSRLFAVNVRDGAAPPGKTYQLAKPSAVAEDVLQNGSEPFRYIGRLKMVAR